MLIKDVKGYIFEKGQYIVYAATGGGSNHANLRFGKIIRVVPRYYEDYWQRDTLYVNTVSKKWDSNENRYYTVPKRVILTKINNVMIVPNFIIPSEIYAIL